MTRHPTPDTRHPIVRMEEVTKRFPGVVANDDVHLTTPPNTIHAVIGENGAGKSTLMNILYGLYPPDAGRIFVRGEEVRIDSPARAIALGIGMVSQHYALIPTLSVLENILMGAEPTQAGGVLDRRAGAQRAEELMARLGVAFDLDAKAGALSVAAQQKAEIVKALYRGAQILILDEPTATLAPQEADALYALLNALRDEGATILFITHKLREVLAHSDQITVLRGGKVTGERLTRETDEQDLLGLMLGARSGNREQATRNKPLTGDDEPEAAPFTPSPLHPLTPFSAPGLLQVSGLHVGNRRGALAVRDVSLEIQEGEILGVAGVDGSGQRELAEAIVGLRRPAQGTIHLGGEEISRLSVAARMARGIAYIPEDRHREGLIMDFTVAENLLLGRQRERLFGGGRLLNLGAMAARGEDVIRRFNVKAPGPWTPGRSLSGGNQQKVVIARAMDSQPRLLVAAQPTRGLDLDAAGFVYRSLRDARSRGLAVLLLSLDLDEIFALSDRIAVLYNGSLVGILPRAEATPEAVGALMLGATGGGR